MNSAILELRNATGSCERTPVARLWFISRCGHKTDSSDFAHDHPFLSDVFSLKRHDAIPA